MIGEDPLDEKPSPVNKPSEPAEVRTLTPAAQRALAEAAARRSAEKEADEAVGQQAKEVGGRDGPEPTRYGDWEKGGIVSDF